MVNPIITIKIYKLRVEGEAKGYPSWFGWRACVTTPKNKYFIQRSYYKALLQKLNATLQEEQDG